MASYDFTFCGCFEEPLQALLAYFLPCVAFGELYAARQGEETPLTSTPCLVGGVISLVPCLNFIFMGMQRGELQTEVGIENEGLVKNILLALFCSCCAVVQDRRQFMKSKGTPQLFMFT